MLVAPLVAVGDEKRGMLLLIIASLGSVCTVVGVCMVMKHDGMELLGWWNWLANGALPPYPLCPFLGKCWQFANSTELTSNESVACIANCVADC